MASHSRLLAAAALAALTLTAGCGAPPQVSPTPSGPVTGATTPPPRTPPPGLPTGTGPSGTPPGSQLPSSCDGDPGPEQVIDLLRAEGVLSADMEATVDEGPLCADGWQYTVVVVPDRDPLQVVTTGPADRLDLVTAGTDVCTIEVRVRAPAGIRTVASCVG